jgi:hypothetical protein
MLHSAPELTRRHGNLDLANVLAFIVFPSAQRRSRQRCAVPGTTLIVCKNKHKLLAIHTKRSWQNNQNLAHLAPKVSGCGYDLEGL